MFLLKEDLKTVATDEIVNKIINNDDTIVDDIIAESIDVMSTYLYERYVTDVIFTQTGNNRSKTLLKHLKGIVIYEIYTRRTKTMNEVAQHRYDEAMSWLEKVAKGEIKPPLPIRMIDTNGDGSADTAQPLMKLGGRKNVTNHW